MITKNTFNNQQQTTTIIKIGFILLLFCLSGITSAQTSELEWALHEECPGTDYGINLSLDDNGNIYMIGSFSDSMSFGNGLTNLVSNGQDDVFILKYDSLHNLLWARSYGGASTDGVNYSLVDNEGNLYLTGGISSNCDYDPGTGVFNLSNGGSGNDFYILKLDSSGNFIWAKAMTSGSSNSTARAMVYDGLGNIYATGYFAGSLDFNPGGASITLIAGSSLGSFVCKYDTAGNVIWATNFSNGYAEGQAIDLDNNGNLYYSGNFNGISDFEPGSGVSNLVSNGYKDVFLLKADTSGNFVWVKAFGGTGWDSSTGLKVDSQGDIIIHGQLQDTVDLDPGSGSVLVATDALTNAYVSKFNSVGVFLWGHSFGGSGYSAITNVDTDDLLNVYMFGVFEFAADFDPGSGSFPLFSNGLKDIFIASLNGQGNFRWAKNFGGMFNDWSGEIEINPSGNIFSTGSFEGMVDFDPGNGINSMEAQGESDFFLLKLSDNYLPVAKFSVSDTVHIAGNTVNFTDISFNNPTSWSWDFGDGTISTLQHPNHAYETYGTYSVTLIVSDSMNSDTALMTDFVVALAPQPPVGWANSIGGSDFQTGNDIATDSLGNVYVVGSYKDNTDFDPGPGSLQFSSNGGTDAFIAKYNPTGALVWAKHVGGIYNDAAQAISFDINGFLLISGIFRGTVDFNPGSGTVNLPGSGVDDVFILKLDTDGNYVWAVKIAGPSMDYSYEIVTDSLSNIYLTGHFLNTIDCDPGPGVIQLSTSSSSSSNYDIFIIKLNQNSNFMWAKQISSLGADTCRSLTLDKFGNCFLTGFIYAQADMDPGSGVYYLGSNNPYSKMHFVLKLDNSGDFVWAKGFETSRSVGMSIDVDPWGNTYTCGTFNMNIDFDPGPGVVYKVVDEESIFLSKLGPDGSFRWAKTIYGQEDISTKHLDVGSNGEIYLCGEYFDVTDIYPESQYENMFTNGETDFFISKFDTSGNLIWYNTYGGPGIDKIESLHVDNYGKVFMTGSYQDIIVVEAISSNITISSQGNSDAFLIKVSPPELFNVQFNVSTTIAAIHQSINFFDETEGFPGHWHWDFGDGNISSMQNPIHAYTLPGYYTVKLNAWGVNGNGELTKTAYIQISPNLIIDTVITNVSCFNFSDGSIDINPVIGSSPFSFTWSTGETNEDLVGVQAGIYTITISDVNNVNLVDSFEILHPMELSISGNVTDDYCTDTIGAIELTFNGGTLPYTVEWSSGQTNQNIDNLFAGSYFLTLIDGNSCELRDSFEVVEMGIFFQIDFNSDSVSCFGGSDGVVSADILGNYPDTFNILWSNGASTSELINLPVGFYEISITESMYQCTETASIEVFQPEDFSHNTDITMVDCFGDSTASISVLSSGATPPYSFTWDNGDTATELLKLPVGSYGCTISDQHNCTDSLFFTISQPQVISISASIINATIGIQNDGALQVFPNGGTPPFTFLWDTGFTTSEIDSLFAGDYALTVTDANLCSWDSVFSIIEVVGIHQNLNVPLQVMLYQNTPNPFNSATDISFFLPHYGNIDLAVYNCFGQRVKSIFHGYQAKGWHTLQFENLTLSAGTYYYKLITESTELSKIMVIIQE